MAAIAKNSARLASRKATNTLLMTMAWLLTGVALFFLLAILWTLVSKGIGGLTLDVFTQSTPAPGSEGGLLNAILGSISMCVIGMIIAVFIGILSGTWLSEYSRGSLYGGVVRFLNDVLLSAPSILIGLFIYGLLVKPFGGFSGLAGAVALAMLAVPVITRATEDVLSLQPPALREASIALGTPMWKTLLSVLWKASRAGLLTGTLLAFARISGETAPLLFTALNNQFLSFDLTGPTANLPVVIFQFALSPFENWNDLAWAGALLIAVVVLAVSTIARIITKEDAK